MRKLLYAFVFASILVLAGFTSFASPNEPGGGGTVPEYAVWLPVVERGLTWHEEYYQCPYLAHPILPSDHAIVSSGEPLTVTFSYEFDTHPSAGLLNWVVVVSSDYRFRSIDEIPMPNPVTIVVPVNKLPPSGTYTWYIIASCWHDYPAPRSVERTITIQPIGQ